MSLPETLSAICAFLLIIFSGKSIKEKDGSNKRNISELAIGFLVMAFTIWASIVNNNAITNISSNNDSLNVKIIDQNSKIDALNVLNVNIYKKDSSIFYLLQDSLRAKGIYITKNLSVKKIDNSTKWSFVDMEGSGYYGVNIKGNTLIVGGKKK